MTWRVFVESMSVVEQTPRTYLSGAYPAMDLTTRDRHRQVVEARRIDSCRHPGETRYARGTTPPVVRGRLKGETL